MFEKFINNLKNDKLKFATICVAVVAFVTGIVVTAVNSGSTYAVSTGACYYCSAGSGSYLWSDYGTPSSTICSGGQWSEETNINKCGYYTITYNSNGGTTLSVPTDIVEGGTIKLGNTVPTRSGASLIGWSKNKEAVSASYQPGGSIYINSNITLYAVWGYSIKYDGNGGNDTVTNVPNSQIKPEFAESLTLNSSRPNRGGYTFKGWTNIKNSSTAKYQPGGSYTENVSTTLYAIWEENETYTLTYNDNTTDTVTNMPPSNTDVIGAITISTTKPDRSGYKFLGWSENKSATTATYQPGATVTITKDTILYAIWTEEAVKRYAYFYLVQVDGATFKDVTTTDASQFYCTIAEGKDSCTITAPEAVKDGYTFTGWYTKGPSVVGGKCENLKDDNGNVVAGKGTVSKGEKVTLYRTKDEAAGKYTTISYYACFTKKSTTDDDDGTTTTDKYNIKYTLNGGTNASGNPTSAKKDAEVTINHPTKSFDVTCDKNNTGATIGTAPKATFTFQGWTSSDLDTSTAMYGSTKWSNGSTLVKDTKFKNLTGVGKTVTLVANWNDVVVKLPLVTKDGYTCKWNTKADGTGTSISSGGDYTVSKNSTSATVYAICTENTGKNKYNIKYELNGGTVTGNPTSAEYDVEVTINQPSKSVTVNCNENKTGATIGKSPVANLEFEGWTSPDVDTSTAMYGTTKWSDRATLVKDTKFKNLTPVNNGTVTMVANWKDGVVTLPSITKKNYTCNWNTSSDGKGASYKHGDKYTVDKNSVSVNMYAICVKNDDNIKNPGTGSSIIIAAWIVGLGAIGFSVYYYMRRRNNI